MTLPSFLAASISCGVTALAGGAADATEANALDATSAVEPLITSRRENVAFLMVASSLNSLSLFAVLAEILPYPLSTRQRSGGRCSHTEAPCGMFSAAGTTTRIWVPSGTSTR